MGLTIRVNSFDDWLFGIDLRAWNERFTATTFIESGLWALGDLASCIAGFPARPEDDRSFSFGSRDSAESRGYCSLRFRAIDSAGHAVVDVVVEDTGPPDGLAADMRIAKAEFSIPVEAAEIDRFVLALREVQRTEIGEAGW
jgi:hypothetical protein